MDIDTAQAVAAREKREREIIVEGELEYFIAFMDDLVMSWHLDQDRPVVLLDRDERYPTRPMWLVHKRGGQDAIWLMGTVIARGLPHGRTRVVFQLEGFPDPHLFWQTMDELIRKMARLGFVKRSVMREPQVLLDFTSPQSLQGWEIEEGIDLLTLEYNAELDKRVLMKKGPGFEPPVTSPPFDWGFIHYEIAVRLSPESYFYIHVLDNTGEGHILVYSSAAIPGQNQYGEFAVPLSKDVSNGNWYSLMIDLPKHMNQAGWPSFARVHRLSLRGEVALAGIRGCDDLSSLMQFPVATPYIVSHETEPAPSPATDSPIPPSKPAEPPPKEPTPPIPRLTWTLLALLFLDFCLVILWGWCLIGDQPNLMAYLQTVFTIVGVPVAILVFILSIVFVAHRSVVLEDALYHLGTGTKWLCRISILTCLSIIITCLFWPLGWVGKCVSAPTSQPTDIAQTTPTSRATEVIVVAPTTPTPTATPTVTLTPMRTPIPTQTNTPTATLTPTSTPTPTQTNTPTPVPPSATPVPTHTPTMSPTATPVAPKLSNPPNGVDLVGQITLSWTWDGSLGSDEYFDVRVWKDGRQAWGVAWTKETQWTGDPLHGDGNYNWQIVVIRGRDGQWESDRSPPSEIRRFSWSGGSSPTPTRPLYPPS
jgi:hypothetical protein